MDVYAAIADPTRREIIALLARGERSAGDIAARFDIAGPSVSRHLKVLREAGIADVRGDAQRRIYSLNTTPLIEAESWMTRQRAIWEGKLDALGSHLDAMAAREKAQSKTKKKGERR